MPKKSAGILLYRFEKDGKLQVLLVHPGGPFWRGKDKGVWSIPKGEVHLGENPMDAAIRELEEEIGLKVEGGLIELPPITQKGGKKVFAWAAQGQWDPANLKSNKFLMEWPPGSGNYKEFPEVDSARWFSIEEAREKIISSQVKLLEELERICFKGHQTKG